MAQTQKHKIRSIILEAASEEFMKKGFKDTSMRAIARLSGVTLSNIYNYFANKDEIFCAVLQPLLDTFASLVEKNVNDEYLNTEVFYSEDYQQKMFDDFMVVVRQFSSEFKLLLFKSAGSSLENFRHTYIETYSASGIEYMRLMKERYPEVKGTISPLFLRMLASLWLTAIGEILKHELTENEINRFVKEYIAFGTAGWKRLLGLN